MRNAVFLLHVRPSSIAWLQIRCGRATKRVSVWKLADTTVQSGNSTWGRVAERNVLRQQSVSRENYAANMFSELIISRGLVTQHGQKVIKGNQVYFRLFVLGCSTSPSPLPADTPSVSSVWSAAWITTPTVLYAKRTSPRYRWLHTRGPTAYTCLVVAFKQGSWLTSTLDERPWLYHSMSSLGNKYILFILSNFLHMNCSLFKVDAAWPNSV